jgi:hypothetical protein
MWEWKTNGRNVIPLTSADNTACFISSVWGTFAGDFDWVQIYRQDGYWVIGGNALNGSPSADAFCVSGVSYTDWTGAHNETNTVKEATADGHTCYFTLIGGNWADPDADARLSRGSEKWSLTSRGGIDVRTRCINKQPFLTGYTTLPTPVALYGDLSDPNNNLAINTTSNSRYFCSLTRIKGQLLGFGGWIGTYNQNIGTNRWQWFVGGKPSTFLVWSYPLSGEARCVD